MRWGRRRSAIVLRGLLLVAGQGGGGGEVGTGRGHDVHEDRGDDVVGGVVVYEETVADTAAAVVAAPDYGPGGVEDGVEGFDQELADSALVVLWWEGGKAVAGKLEALSECIGFLRDEGNCIIWLVESIYLGHEK